MRRPSTKLATRHPLPSRGLPLTAHAAPAEIDLGRPVDGAHDLHVLVAHGRRDVVADLGYLLARLGFRVTTALTGPEAVTALRLYQPNVVVIGDPLPGIAGSEIVRRLRAAPADAEGREVAAVMLLGPEAGVEARIDALTLGADDCVTWPGDPRELALRVSLVLRRSTRVRPRHDEVIEVRGVRLDVARAEVTVDGVSVHFTRTELDLLWILARHPGTVFTRSQLTAMVWGDAQTSHRRVDRHVHGMRLKLGPYAALIETRSRTGYRFAASPGA